jgi:predicted aconitase
MRLTPDQESMLRGRNGRAPQLAMTMLAAVGRAMDAVDLIPVASAHILIDVFAMGKPGADLIVSMAESGARFVVPTTINAISYDRRLGPSADSAFEFDLHQRRMLDACQAMGGVATCSCNPFSQGIAPSFGEHVAWSESATTGYVNSVIGARSNREGATAMASALTGVTPRYGMHLPANRRATVHFEIGFQPADGSEFNLLGSLIARRSQTRIPVLSGLRHPGVDELFGFGASFAIVANIPMFHIVGVTPEARSLEDACGGPPGAPVAITRADLDGERAIFDADRSTDVNLVTIGAPHATIHQISEVAALLGDRKVKPGIEFTLTTNRSNFALAESSGLLARLVAAGVTVTADKMCFGCDLGGPKYGGAAVLATNSVKAALSAPGTRGVRTRYGTTRQCVDAAVTGIWRK